MELLPRLKMARERVAQGWIQNNYARTSTGEGCDPVSSNACCWCIVGAGHALYDPPDYYMLHTLEKLINAPQTRGKHGGYYDSIAEWNDAPGRTQAEVLALLDKAIEEVSNG